MTLGSLRKKMRVMVKTEHDKVAYCRNFLRGWCKAGPDSLFKVVKGFERPRCVSEGGREVVVVGDGWLAANAIPARYLEG